MNDLHTTIFLRTRKVHRCEWCGTDIDKGSDAARCKGRHDGDWYDYRLHLDCSEAMAVDDCLDEDGEFVPHSHQRGKTCDDTARAAIQDYEQVNANGRIR